MEDRAIEILETALKLATIQYNDTQYEIKQRIDTLHHYLETQLEDWKNEKASSTR